MSRLIKGECYGYTNIDNAVFRDTSISAKAKGVLCQMLSLPDHWEYSIAGLATRFTDGKDSIRSALVELEEHGYLVRKQQKSEGKFAGYDYVVFANPANAEASDFPLTEIPTTGIPMTGNPTQLNNNILNTKESNTNTNNICASKRFTPPTVQQVQEYVEEKGYHIDAEKFVDYYISNGWKVGKNSMKDWKAAVRTWERNNYGNDNRRGSSERRSMGTGNGDTESSAGAFEDGWGHFPIAPTS